MSLQKIESEERETFGASSKCALSAYPVPGPVTDVVYHSEYSGQVKVPSTK